MTNESNINTGEVSLEDNPPGTMLSRGLSSVWTGYENTVYDGMASISTWWSGEETTREDMREFDERITTQADAALYQAGVDAVETVQLSFSSNPEDVAESNRRLRDGLVTAGDGVVDAVFGVAGLVTGVGAYAINRTPEAFGYEPTFGEDYTAWSAFEAVSGADDVALGSLYDGLGYELRTDGSYGLIHGVAEVVGTGGAGGVVIKGGTRLAMGVRATDAAVDGVRTLDRAADVTQIGPTRAAAAQLDGQADELAAAAFKPSPGMVDNMVLGGADDAAEFTASSIPRVTRAPRTAEGPWGPVPRTVTSALDDAPAASRTSPQGPVASIADDAPAAVARPGNTVTRTVSAAVSKNSPRGIYRSGTDTVSDKLTRLARSEDTVGAQSYMRRLVNDVGAGRPGAKIDESQITTLRTSGQLDGIMIGKGDSARPLIDALQSAKDASRSMLGRTGHSLGNLGDTFRANASVGSLLKTTLVNPINPLWYARHMKGFAALGAGYQANNLVFGNETVESGFKLAGDIVTEPVQWVGAGLDKIGDIAGDNFVGNAFNAASGYIDVMTAPLDLDTTVLGQVTGELQEAGHTGKASMLSMATGTTPEIDSRGVTPPTTTATSAAALAADAGATAPEGGTGVMTPEQESQLQQIMESFARSPVGQFLDSIGPWGQMIAFGLAATFAGQLGLKVFDMIPGMPDINNGLTSGLAAVGAVLAAPMLADMFHNASNNTGPKPSEVVANTMGGVDLASGVSNLGNRALSLVQG